MASLKPTTHCLTDFTESESNEEPPAGPLSSWCLEGGLKGIFCCWNITILARSTGEEDLCVHALFQLRHCLNCNEHSRASFLLHWGRRRDMKSELPFLSDPLLRNNLHDVKPPWGIFHLLYHRKQHFSVLRPGVWESGLVRTASSNRGMS